MTDKILKLFMEISFIKCRLGAFCVLGFGQSIVLYFRSSLPGGCAYAYIFKNARNCLFLKVFGADFIFYYR